MLISCLESSLFCFQLVQTTASKYIFLTPAAWTTSRGLAPLFSPSQTHPLFPFLFLPMENFHAFLPIHHLFFNFITGKSPSFYSLSPLSSFKFYSLQKACLKNKNRKIIAIKVKGGKAFPFTVNQSIVTLKKKQNTTTNIFKKMLACSGKGVIKGHSDQLQVTVYIGSTLWEASGKIYGTINMFTLINPIFQFLDDLR